ncbi:unnamed protein product, partial [Adineta steineri]
NTLLLPSDGDVALSKLGYYDQERNETSASVSLFCDAFDGPYDQTRLMQERVKQNVTTPATYSINFNNNLYTIYQKQGDRVSANLTRIDTRF